jgi:protease II
MAYPFLDVLGLLLDKDKPLSESDYAEFGNPN